MRSWHEWRLRSGSIEVRRRAAYALRRKGGERSASALELACSDADASVRRAALYALTACSPSRARDMAAALLEDESPEVRSAAADHAAALGMHELVPALMERLDDPPRSTPWRKPGRASQRRSCVERCSKARTTCCGGARRRRWRVSWLADHDTILRRGAR